jgi:purine-nucleoside phosphorylase
MVKQVEQTADFLKTKLQTIPQAAIVLGSGLDKLSEDIQTDVQLSYKDIPHFPVSTVQGHAGQLIMGQLGGVNVLAMKGRFHYYEGYNMQQITFPVRVFKQLGINVLILSNASGGMNPAYQIGDIVLLTDHINHFPESPLRGYNHDGWGDRFPDMSQTYSLRLRDAVKQIADKHRILIKEGVYVGTAGPAFETPAEYVMFWRMGADCVGMSTVPEAIVARHAGMECVAFSIITDLGIEGRVEKVSHADVLKAAQNAQPKLRCLVTELVKRLHAEVAS